MTTTKRNEEITLADGQTPFAVDSDDSEGRHYWKPVGWTSSEKPPDGPYFDNGISPSPINFKTNRPQAVISAHNSYVQHRQLQTRLRKRDMQAACS